MTRRRNIALIAGGATALLVFSLAMWVLVFGGYYTGSKLLIFASIALAPVAMGAVMAGYAVWWLVLFLITLVGRSDDLHDGS
jgi:hypothetical protein